MVRFFALGMALVVSLSASQAFAEVSAAPASSECQAACPISRIGRVILQLSDGKLLKAAGLVQSVSACQDCRDHEAATVATAAGSNCESCQACQESKTAATAATACSGCSQTAATSTACQAADCSDSDKAQAVSAEAGGACQDCPGTSAVTAGVAKAECSEAAAVSSGTACAESQLTASSNCACQNCQCGKDVRASELPERVVHTEVHYLKALPQAVVHSPAAGRYELHVEDGKFYMFDTAVGTLMIVGDDGQWKSIASMSPAKPAVPVAAVKGATPPQKISGEHKLKIAVAGTQGVPVAPAFVTSSWLDVDGQTQHDLKLMLKHLEQRMAELQKELESTTR